MTRLLMGAGAALLLAMIASYVLIPSTIVFSKVIYLGASAGTAERAFYNSEERDKWWPTEGGQATHDNSGNKHSFGNYSYEFPLQTFSGSSISIYQNDRKLSSSIYFVSFRTDSIAIKWKSELPPTNNPFKKISNYVLAMSVKKNMAEILDTVKVFLAKPDNLYGLKIVQEKVRDTVLLATRWNSSTYPSTEIIYEKIDALKNYIRSKQGIETNHPMLHVFGDRGEFQIMVAIPIEKALPTTEVFELKKMVPGKILTAEVRGGWHTSGTAIKKLEQYIEDQKITSPAIPFESLVTNRMQEKDTTKWITKVYYPIY